MKMEMEPQYPSFSQAVRYWFRLGLISFGGPAGQISVMHREIVEQRRWMSESHFLHALNFCMLLPGPEAQQLATYLGWRLHGWKGGIAAGSLFVLPSMFILYALSWLYVMGANSQWLSAIFYGLIAAVMAVVVSALLRIGRKALKTPGLWIVAAFSFIAIFVFKVSFVLVIIAAALAGMLGNKFAPLQFPAAKGHGASGGEEGEYVTLPPVIKPTWKRAAGVLVLCLALWWVPIIGVGLWLGWNSTAFNEGVFFSKAAMVTFGGAYAVLPYVAQQAVEQFKWVSHSQMMSGLGFAETTPGPLIMVLQFVGFVGGWQNPGTLEPWQAATIGALITTWATFVPCFMMIFLGGPHVEGLRANPRLSAALTGITAAVVGVILNLTVWFGWKVLWPQGWKENAMVGGIDLFAASAGVAALIAMERFKLGLIPTIGICAALGLVWKCLLI